ncbi:MAG UNVERIFIED_CONTAM: OmpW family protein [Rickettsiaceae bacterium]
MVNLKLKNFLLQLLLPAKPHESFFTNGYGLTGASTVFFTDHVAAELSAGVYVLRTSNSAINNAQYNYGNSGTQMKRKDVYGVPLDLTLQFHVAPFGAIRPYVGAGYNGTYMYVQSRQFKIGHTHGPVLQAGLDFVMNDDSVINIDVKRYSWSPKVTYTDGFLGARTGAKSGRVKFEPVVVSLGFGLKFLIQRIITKPQLNFLLKMHKSSF